MGEVNLAEYCLCDMFIMMALTAPMHIIFFTHLRTYLVILIEKFSLFYVVALEGCW